MKNSTKTYLIDRLHRSLSEHIIQELIDDIKDNEGWEVLYVLEKTITKRKAFMKRYHVRSFVNEEIKLKRIEPGKRYKVTTIK